MSEDKKIVEGETKELTPEELQKQKMEEVKKIQDARMEEIVITAREKILPFLKEKNKTIEESKRIVETLAITVNQGLYLLMKEFTVAKLELLDKINKDYPDYDCFVELIKIMEGSTMEMAIESLQWISQKMDAIIKEENKKRDFMALGMDLDLKPEEIKA
jgi:hypothetical protein